MLHENNVDFYIDKIAGSKPKCMKDLFWITLREKKKREKPDKKEETTHPQIMSKKQMQPKRDHKKLDRSLFQMQIQKQKLR